MGETKMEKSDMEIEMEMETEKATEKVEKTEKRGSGIRRFRDITGRSLREATNLISEAPSSKIAILVKCHDAVPVYADDDDNEDDAEEEDQSSEMFWWDDPKVSESTNPEVLKAAVDSIEEMLDMLKAELNAQSSGNHKDLHNDNAESKP